MLLAVACLLMVLARQDVGAAIPAREMEPILGDLKPQAEGSGYQIIPFMMSIPVKKLSNNFWQQQSEVSSVFHEACLALLPLMLVAAKMFVGATYGGPTASVTGLGSLVDAAENNCIM
jgi:hypothetical protein